MSEIGEGQVSGDYLRPVTWLEIECWTKLVGLNLMPFEYNALHLLSANYVNQYNSSNNVDCDSPCIEVKQENEQRVEGKLKSLFAMMRGSDK